MLFFPLFPSFVAKYLVFYQLILVATFATFTFQ